MSWFLAAPIHLLLMMIMTILCASYGDIISTIVGTGTSGNTGDNEQATSATVNSPYGIALDLSGNCYTRMPINLFIIVSKIKMICQEMFTPLMAIIVSAR